MKKGFQMLLTAIAVGFVLGDTLAQKYKIINAFEYGWIIVVSIAAIIMIFYAANETYLLISGIKSDRQGKVNRRHNITYHNCSRERELRELEKQRNEFFEKYFRESSIQMKTRK